MNCSKIHCLSVWGGSDQCKIVLVLPSIVVSFPALFPSQESLGAYRGIQLAKCFKHRFVVQHLSEVNSKQALQWPFTSVWEPFFMQWSVRPLKGGRFITGQRGHVRSVVNALLKLWLKIFEKDGKNNFISVWSSLVHTSEPRLHISCRNQ